MGDDATHGNGSRADGHPLGLGPEGIDTFIEDLAEAIEVDPAGLDADTRLDRMDRWDSLAALSAIAMIFAVHRVQVSGDDLVACTTIGDLHDRVRAKAAAQAS